jgi:Ca2+-binding EF-hand superfamily protein
MQDHNGKISVTELKQVMTDELIYQNEQIEDMMKEVDVNGDGEVTLLFILTLNPV